jgi:UDPglucose 6-dehydrogenase
MRLAILGGGYVGLVTATCLANLGFWVHCVDIDKRKVRCIKSGSVPFHEPGLAEALKSAYAHGRFDVSADVASAVAHADVVFIAVGTPSGPDGSAELGFIEDAALQIAQSMRPGCIVVTKSTVPVGTGGRLRQLIKKTRPGVPFSMASNPEFLREGSAIEDFLCPDRIVIGVDDENGRQALRRIYAPLTEKGATLVETGIRAAEIIKYAANAFLATKIAFINEVADLCEGAGADVDEVAAAVGLDRRIGGRFLEAGPGFGGSCFPKDIRAFAAMGVQFGTPQTLVAQVEKSNETRKLRMAQRILRFFGNSPAGKTVAILGIAFKPHTDDVRESPSLTIIPALQAAGVKIRAHDYAAIETARPLLKGVAWCSSPYAAVKDADAAVILTDWPDYRKLDLAEVASSMRGNLIFDSRRVLSPINAAQNGLELVATGRGNVIELESARTPEKSGRSKQQVASSVLPVPARDSGRSIMVAGGAGFLGSHLCERLLKEGHHVLCVDNLSTGQMQSVTRLRRYRRFTFLSHDVSHPIGAQVDEIYNLACPASPRQYQADAVQTIKTSVFGAAHLLDLAERRGAKILQASTSEIYGDPLVHPQPESYWGHVNPIGIRSCYDEGKRCAETLFFDYQRQRNVRIKVARIFNTYGPHMHPEDGRVVSNFIIQALSGEDLTIYGDGSQTRSFCYVDDLVDGIIRLMQSPDSIAGPVNLGNPAEFTVLELANLVREMTATASRLVFLPIPLDDPRQRRPDTSKAAELLGWKPQVCLRDGLEKTIAYFAATLDRSPRDLEEMVVA